MLSASPIEQAASANQNNEGLTAMPTIETEPPHKQISNSGLEPRRSTRKPAGNAPKPKRKVYNVATVPICRSSAPNSL
jgi:hypothetical protein